MSEQPAARLQHLAAVPDSPEERLEELARLAASAADHDEQAARHTAAAAADRAAAMKLHGARGTTVHAGNYALTWKKPNATFQQADFEKTYPLELNPGFYKTPEVKPVLDKDSIPPNLKAKFMKPGGGEGSLIIK